MKLVRLILVIGKDVFVEVLIGRFPGADYGNALIGMKGRLSPFLNVAQRQKIFPEASKYTGNLSDLDISLLYIILRNLNTIASHRNGWGNDPEDNDRTPSANIDRIRIAKNTIVSHSSSFSIGYTCFNNKWKAMRQCCVELGGEKFGVTIDSLLTSSFNCDSEQQISELVRNLKENDLQFERSLYKIEDLIRQLIDSIHRGQSCEERETTTHIEDCCTSVELNIEGNNLPCKTEVKTKLDQYENKDISQTSVTDGSIIICLEMFSSAFQKFGYFLAVIDGLLQHIFPAVSSVEDEIVEVIKISVQLFEKFEEIPIELGPDRKLNTQMLLSKELLRFQNEYGIIIESISKKDLSYKAEPWNSDERLDILKSKEFPEGFKLHTDIFHISQFKTDGKRIPAKDIRFKVLLPAENSSYHEYKGAIKIGKDWKLIDYSIQVGYMVFEVDHVESFCVLSLLREEKHTILPSGSQFISYIDKRIQITFPPNAVTKEKHITFKIHPVNVSCILERTTESTNNDVSINVVSPGISTVQMKFKKMFKVQLPLQSIFDSSGNTEDYIYYICKWTDDGSFEFIDLQPLVSNGLVCFETNSCGGYGCVRTLKSHNTSSLSPIVQEGYGLKKWCKILFFVGKTRNFDLSIMLECVDLKRVSDVCEKRKKDGYRFVSEWISKDCFLFPDKTIITVDVRGKFTIPKYSIVKHPRLSFIPVAHDNFTRFLVELIPSGIVDGVSSTRYKGSIPNEIYFDPESTNQIIPNKKIRHYSLHKGVGLGAAKSKPSTVPNPIVRDFFTDKGLLALSKSMSPDTMLDVCINMDVTISTFDTLRKIWGTTRGNIAYGKQHLISNPIIKEYVYEKKQVKKT
ncbi:Hypothetical predicted protein [Mytilus galloprovincialis]|uniref:DZIP3-like HEPN domain-containing protein n=1 Tax=Mytilus galloprovincialis TaxID=29158 RepID=A0A8B6F2I4_MYTGA|nr:Hypothetical predicted protein [Mytilus galloprovincialis]